MVTGTNVAARAGLHLAHSALPARDPEPLEPPSRRRRRRSGPQRAGHQRGRSRPHRLHRQTLALREAGAPPQRHGRVDTHATTGGEPSRHRWPRHTADRRPERGMGSHAQRRGGQDRMGRALPSPPTSRQRSSR